MRRTGAGVLPPLILAAALAGCGGSGPGDAAPSGTPALASYTAPPGAPGFCTLLARTGSVRQLPTLLGRLSVQPWNATAAFQLFQSRSDLVAVLVAVRAEGGSAALTAQLQDLVDALRSAADAGVSAESADRVRADLAAVGRTVQPVCGYPT